MCIQGDGLPGHGHSTGQRMIFKIPVGNYKKYWWQFWKSKAPDTESIKKLIDSYKDKVIWDDITGEVKINGEPMRPFKKEYWIPVND